MSVTVALVMFAWAILMAWGIAGQQRTVEAFGGMPMWLAVVFLVGSVAAGTLILTQFLIRHHWISN